MLKTSWNKVAFKVERDGCALATVTAKRRMTWASKSLIEAVPNLSRQWSDFSKRGLDLGLNLEQAAALAALVFGEGRQ